MADGARAESAPLTGMVLGRYSIGRLLGEGGMGAVYQATHQELGRRVAIKTLHERFAASPEARQRFLREGRAAAQIRHPNVADVYDVAIEGSCPYLVLELLEGEDLASLIARDGPLSAQRTADILVPVVAALAAAHDSGIVHRDLKPENIFLANARGAVVPKVLDFGISKLTDGEPLSLTGTGAVLGTPHYMSPEQAQGTKQVDARSDQYSLGVVLYHSATGRRPLHGVPLYSLIQRTVHGDFPPPRQVHPALPSAFEEVILRAMARAPERRFASTRALGQALLPFASDGVRAEYAEELGGEAAPAPAPLPVGPTPYGLSSTLGESAAHVRAVAEKRQRSPRSLLLGALLLAAVLVWRFGLSSGPSPAVPAPAPVASGPATSTQPLRPSDSAAASRAPATSAQSDVERAAAFVSEAEQNLARGQLALAVDGFRRAYALSLEPSALERGAEAQMRLWRGERRPGECRTARDLWLARLAVASEPRARQHAQSMLTELGDCGDPAAATSPAPAAEPRPATRVVPPRPAVAAPNLPAPHGAGKPPSPSQAAAPERPAPTARPLPSDDPVDGFVGIGAGGAPREQ